MQIKEKEQQKAMERKHHHKKSDASEDDYYSEDDEDESDYDESEDSESDDDIPKNIWIIKPGENSNRGNGIQVANTVADIRRIVGTGMGGDKKHTYIV